MCILPIGVGMEHRNKYVACLIGDELADDEEFGKLVGSKFEPHGGYEDDNECRFCFYGTCFHPFRPGSMCDAIFSSTLRSHSTAEKLVNKEACKILDGRGCVADRVRGPCECQLKISRKFDGSAFDGIAHFYDEMLELACKRTFYGQSFDKFRDKYKTYIDEKTFFGNNDDLRAYEDNIRKHFNKMMKAHFLIIENAMVLDSNIPVDKERKNVSRAIQKVRLDLVTHWIRYWEAGKYKEKVYGEV